MVGPHRAPRKRQRKPIAAAALVLAVAMGSAAVWVAFAAPTPLADQGEPPWWPGLSAVPTR